MPKQTSQCDESKKISIYTTILSKEYAEKLKDLCIGRGFEIKSVPYSDFAFKAEDFNLVMYTSGKLVVQGKGTEDFVKYTLEICITGTPKLGYESVEHPEWFESHAGMDESGKGDLFGPLVTACVIADGDTIKKWMDDGVKDSKKITSQKSILLLDKKIRNTSNAVVKTMYLSMLKYNELYDKFGNLNKLLAWMHSQSLLSALKEKHVTWGMLDQFSKQPLVQNFINVNQFELKMQTKAEADPVVAAASIVARAEYVRQMQKLSDVAGFKILKGASKQTQAQINQLEDKFGNSELKNFAKMHFKCADQNMFD